MAKKLESTLKNMALSLFLICGIMSAALGIVYSLTKEPIENAEKQKVNDAIRLVVPAFDNDPGMEVYKSNGFDMYPAKVKGKIVGVAVKAVTNKGFAGEVAIMVGFKPDGSIYNTSVMSQKETPGLGTKMVEPKFRDQFNGKIPGVYKVSVKKDGGDVDAITAATISSRAFCYAVNEAYKAYVNSVKVVTPVNSIKQVEGGKK
jgi:electron transport complex protein RnfG